MWCADRPARAGALLSILVCGGCITVAVYGEPGAGSDPTEIIRVDEDRGIDDESMVWWVTSERRPTAGAVRLTIPLEVRAPSSGRGVDLTGCAVRPFSAPTIEGPGFGLDSIRSFGSLTFPNGDSFVPAGARRRVVAVLDTTVSPGPNRSLGIKIDERETALTLTGGCDSIGFGGPDIQHYGFRRVEVEPFGVGTAALALVLVGILVIPR